MIIIKIRIESSGNDWQRIFVDGEEIYCHHDISAEEFLYHLKPYLQKYIPDFEFEDVWGEFIDGNTFVEY